jgi:uncharacterized peroxidase-related enzyme
MTRDVLDELLGIAPGSPLDALRALRPEARAAIAGSEAAIYGWPSGLSRVERHAVALAVAEWHDEATLAARHRPLAGHSPRLDALLAHAELLTLAPDRARPAAVEALLAVGLAPRDVVMLGQLIAYEAFKARMLATLRLLAGEAGAPPRAVPTAPPPGGTGDFGFTMETLEWLAWAPVLDLAAATGGQIAVLEESHARAKTSPYYLLLVQEEEVLRQRSRLFNTIMYGRGGASRAERELAATAESLVNGCPYCASVHAQRYVQLSKDETGMNRLLAEGVTVALPPRLRAIVDFSVALSATPHAAGAGHLAKLRDEGLADAEILDIGAAVAMFAWANRLMQTLGEPVRP